VHCTGKLAHSHSYLRRILPHNRFSLPIKAASSYAPSAAKERERRKREEESVFRQAQTLETKIKIRALHWAGNGWLCWMRISLDGSVYDDVRKELELRKWFTEPVVQYRGYGYILCVVLHPFLTLSQFLLFSKKRVSGSTHSFRAARFCL
jgi:hypothetical protein